MSEDQNFQMNEIIDQYPSTSATCSSQLLPITLQNGNSSQLNVGTKTKRKRKRKEKSLDFDFSKLSSEAQELQLRERQRLERLDKNKEELAASIYTPLLIKPKPTHSTAEQSIQNEYKNEDLNSPSNDEGDDDLIIEEVIQKGQSKKVDYIELGSSEDEATEPTTSSAFTNASLHRNNAAFLQQLIHRSQQERNERMHGKRKRRNSADYDKKEITPEGRLIINADKPEGDPDVFVAPHLTQVLQPHQIGGVKFMYDNIIETLNGFQRAEGNGCILAHSMGLGKTIQAITFIEIFIRITGQKRVLIICPVNVLQNWKSELDEKWLPKVDPQTGTTIREWNLFVLGDAIKSMNARAQLINEWHEQGGVLLIGYEMFRLLIQSERENGSQTISRKKARKAQQQRTVWDLEENLSKLSEEEKQGIIQREERRQTLKQALLSPGPDLVICDEGHRIKNLNTDVASALSAIHTKRRIVLTGYPLQNNLMEYYCMVEFVRPSYLGSRRDFSLMFDKPIRSGQCIDSTPADVKMAQKRIHVLTNLLRGFVQRRSHHILKKILPESREFVLLLRKSSIQHALYRAFHHYAKGQVITGDMCFNPLKAFAICMKIVNHPDLLYEAVLKKRQKNGNDSDEDDNESQKHAEDGIKQEELPIACTTDPSLHSQQPHTSNTSLPQQQPTPTNQSQQPTFDSWRIPPFNGNQQWNHHQQNYQQINQNYSQWQPNCQFPPPQESRNMGINSMNLNTNNGIWNHPPWPQPKPPPLMAPQQYNFPSANGNFGAPIREYFPFPVNSQQQQQYMEQSNLFPGSAPVCQQPFQQNGHFPTLNTYGNQPQPSQRHDYFKQNNGANAQQQLDQQEGERRRIFEGTFLDEENPPALNENIKREATPSLNQPEEKQTTPSRKKKTQKEVNDLLSDEFLFEDGSISLEWAEPFLKDYAKGVLENSSKLFVAMKIIAKTVRRGEKLLLFSQSVVTLNLIEAILKKQTLIGLNGEKVKFCRNKTYCRFDGSTSGVDREKLINRFNEDTNLKLFLISTRAGSLGVNLVSANRVIIYDVSWNPCHDAQAICRIYRYGQKRKTFIYRLIMGNCMEKQVFNRQIQKQGLQKRVIDEQMIDANVTTKEVENLMDYNEAMDVNSDFELNEEFNVDEEDEQMDDDLLKELVKEHGCWFMETPFLHESMMLEREDGLSKEEKLEAELLYEREKRGLNFPTSQEQVPMWNIPNMEMQRRFPAMTPDFAARLGFASRDYIHLTQTTPLPKLIEFSGRQQPHQERRTERLPKVLHMKDGVNFYKLYPGQHVTIYQSQTKLYLRTLDGVILDGTDNPLVLKLFSASDPLTAQNGHNEVIQIDD